jgi:iron only hydrogenase large subunit-like protein
MSQYLKLRQKNCRSCHKCIRHCPLKAIRFSGGHARIIAEDCIWCGLCYAACPQTTKEIFSERYAVEGFLKAGNKVVASLAPSFAAQYGGATIADVETALKKLGFAMAEETVVGATKVCEAYNALLDEGRDIVISSSCPSVNLMIQKYFPDAIDYLAPVLSPMQTHALDIKTRIPDAKVVFIGPCTAKKAEARLDTVKPYVDAVLTFEELQALFDSRDIEITELPEEPLDNASYFGRIFARSGGLTDAVRQALKEQGLENFQLKPCACDGIEECRLALLKKSKNLLDANFIEGMACVGGCIGGAGCLTHGEKSKTEVDKYGEEALEKSISDAISAL